MIRFGSVCSGIEAASVAWEPLGWKAAWFAEIEPFPCAVLAHHYPDVVNFGDMTKLPELILSEKAEAPDLLCGGTPCQAFSVAGLRQSLSDPRGNLSLVFCQIADAIDSVRTRLRKPGVIIFWENVPGVLTTNDNAFGCFLGALVGSDAPLSSGSDRWPCAGFASGPKRKVAWRVLDAQHFGVPQRRRRVFVVGCPLRGGADPTKILFERKGVFGNSDQSCSTREAVAGNAENSSAKAGRTIGTLTASDFQKNNFQDCQKFIYQGFRESSFGTFKEGDLAGTLKARGGGA